MLNWCYGFYNHDRRHSTIAMVSPFTYENGPPTGKPHKEAPRFEGTRLTRSGWPLSSWGSSHTPLDDLIHLLDEALWQPEYREIEVM